MANNTVASTFGQARNAPKSPNAPENFLDRFGLDTRSQQEILAQMAQQRIIDAQAANDRNPERFAGQHSLEDSGAAIASMLANKFNKPQLSPEQQRSADAKASADKQIMLLEAGGALTNDDGDLDVFKKTDEYQRILAGELIKVGDPRGIDMARELQKRIQDQAIYEEERVGAGLDIEGKRITNQSGRLGNKRQKEATKEMQFDFKRKQFLAKRGLQTAVYMAGSDNPNASIMAFIGDDGNALTQDKEGNMYAIPLGDYTTIRPEDPKAGTRGSKTGFEPTPTEQSDVRGQQRALAQQARLAVTMRDVLSDAVNDDGTINILGGSGKGIGFATKMVDNVNAMFAEGKKTLTFLGDDNKVSGGYDGSVSGGLSYVEANPELFEGFRVPDAVRSKGDRAVSRYQAAIVQMAYAKARANEPGARMISENDFKNAIKQIGANATDPEALRQILFGDIERGLQDFRLWKAQIGPENYNRIVNPAADKEFNLQMENFAAAFGPDNSFGSATNAGPGLTNPQGDRAVGSPTPLNQPPVDRSQETPEQKKARILGIPEA